MTIYEVAFHYGIGSNDFYNVVHFDITGDEPLDLQDLTDQIVTQWGSSQAAATTPQCSFRDITYRLDIIGSVGSTITPTAGAVAGNAANTNWGGQMAVLVQKKTNGLVRPVLGRAFCPGIAVGNLNEFGEWGAATLNACENFWDGIRIVPFAGNGQAEMLLKASNPAAPNTNAYNSVTECVALAIPVALQSRKKGRGA